MRAYTWIERLRTHLGGNIKDVAIARRLGVTPAAISRYKLDKGRTLSDDVAIAIAAELGIDPMEIIADQHAEQAETRRAKVYWERISRSVAAAILAIGISSYPVDLYAKTSAITQDTVFIMRNFLRRLFGRKQLANAM